MARGDLTIASRINEASSYIAVRGDGNVHVHVDVTNGRDIDDDWKLLDALTAGERSTFVSLVKKFLDKSLTRAGRAL